MFSCFKVISIRDYFLLGFASSSYNQLMSKEEWSSTGLRDEVIINNKCVQLLLMSIA